MAIVTETDVTHAMRMRALAPIPTRGERTNRDQGRRAPVGAWRGTCCGRGIEWQGKAAAPTACAETRSHLEGRSHQCITRSAARSHERGRHSRCARPYLYMCRQTECASFAERRKAAVSWRIACAGSRGKTMRASATSLLGRLQNENKSLAAKAAPVHRGIGCVCLGDCCLQLHSGRPNRCSTSDNQHALG